MLWEAQFGDFVNGAQIVIDQFLVAGRSKWGQTSRLTLLLPHGYEGNGPEHSSARLERFLQQGAQDNIRIANCTTSAQFFHLLRRQALDATARPLVVMTPKGLLRLKQASSTLDELATGSFHPVIPDPAAGTDVRRLVLCSGKVYYDIVGHDERAGATGVAVARLEQLYPFPVEAVAELIAALPDARGDRVGAGGAAEHGRLALDPASARRRGPLELVGARASRYVGRTWRASPERGLSDRAPARAGPDRAGRARRRYRLISVASSRLRCVPPPSRPLRAAARGCARPRATAAAARSAACARACTQASRQPRDSSAEGAHLHILADRDGPRRAEIPCALRTSVDLG